MTEFSFASGNFIDTLSSRAIIATIEKAQRASRCAMITGASGTGKTATTAHLARQSEGLVKIVTALKVNGSLKSFLMDVGHVIGCNAVGASAFMIYSKIKDFTTPNEWGEHHRDFDTSLLVFDEVQHLDFETWRVLLELHRRSGLVMVFMGNRDVLKKTQTHDAALDQIANRIPFRLSLDKITLADIQAFGIAYNVEGIAAHQYLAQFGIKRDFHQLTYLLDEARSLVGPRGSIRIEHLRDAVALLHGEDAERGLFKLISKPKKEEDAA